MSKVPVPPPPGPRLPNPGRHDERGKPPPEPAPRATHWLLDPARRTARRRSIAAQRALVRLRDNHRDEYAELVWAENRRLEVEDLGKAAEKRYGAVLDALADL